ncbi:hypothetical protein D9M71_279150 [compost metagenome]
MPYRLVQTGQLQLTGGLSAGVGENKGIALFIGKIATGSQGDGCLAQVDQRQVLAISNHSPPTTARPWHVDDSAVEARPFFIQLQIAQTAGLNQGDRPFRHFHTGVSQQRCRKHGFRQWKWRLPVANGAQNQAGIEPVGTTSAGAFRY